MSIDDEDSKVRRNLVTFCTTLLLFAWLRIPLSSITTKYVGGSAIDPLRLWLAGAAVLAYLYLRYHFAGGGREAFSRIKELYRSAANDQIDQFLPAHFHDETRVTCVPSLHSILEKFRQQQAAQHAESAGSEPRMTFVGWTRVEPIKYSGKIALTATWPRIEGVTDGYQASDDNVAYSIAAASRRKFSALAFWRSWMFSAASVTHLTAMVLTVLTTFLIGYRLYQILRP